MKKAENSNAVSNTPARASNGGGIGIDQGRWFELSALTKETASFYPYPEGKLFFRL